MIRPSMQEQAPERFAGADKTSHSLFAPLERRLAPLVLPHIPAWLETYHLTWLTLVWCIFIVVFSALARRNLQWLWMVSAMILLQYVTDHFDGKVGKYRNTGLVKWGYYMDHFLDYVFLCSVIVGYVLILPERSTFHLLLMLAVCAGFMIHTFLTVVTLQDFTISYLKVGPTEFRLSLVVINALLATFGTEHMQHALPYVAASSALVLGMLVWRTQRRVWEVDMARKRRETQANP